MTLVADIQYFSPVIFYLKLESASHCTFDQYENFEKRSFRNRCTLAGANAPIDLSIPVAGGRLQKTPMKDVKIDHSENWRARHWKTIHSCYRRSPWFEYYADELSELYEEKIDRLVDWNLRCFGWVCDKMAISTRWTLSERYEKNYDAQQYLDLRGRIVPATVAEQYPLPFVYPQVFAERHGFLPNLSILDYLFCVGRTLPRTQN